MADAIHGSIFWILLLSSVTLGSSLIATHLSTVLPSAMYGITVFYDGHSDFIYLLGVGNTTDELQQILRFDISTEIVENIGGIPNPSGKHSPVAEDSNGDIVYFDSEGTKIYKLRTTDNTLTRVGNLNVEVYMSASAKTSAGEVLIFGGTNVREQIIVVNIESDPIVSSFVGNLSEPFKYTECAQLANNTAIVFGTEGRVPYVMLDLETLESRNVTPNRFPGFQHGMTVAKDEDFVYLFGGTFADTPSDGILRLDTTTNEWEFISVENFPDPADCCFRYAPSVVWVQKLNRIYMFGGLLNCNWERYMDDIWYIDLNSVSPTTSPYPTTTPPTSTHPTTTDEPSLTSLHPDLFSCENRTEGTHPHPSDCSKYIACTNGTVEGVHSCAPPLLYDPLLETCNLPSLVDCDLSCETREDGMYPHPQECNLFIICSQRDLFVFWCEYPLLFDPVELKCNLPSLVTCQV